MPHIVAFLDQDVCKIFRSMGEVPDKAVAFESPEALAKIATAQSLDRVRERLLGQTTGKSSSSEDAARRLWYVLTLGADALYQYSLEKKKDLMGNDKWQDNTKIELIKLVYSPGADHMADFFYKKLPSQAKKIIEILTDDDRWLWTNDEANSLVLARADEIPTKQGAAKVFTYYKSELFAKKMLKRMTYLELAACPEFGSIADQL